MGRAAYASGSPITAERDYFFRDGIPYPVVGMTYMDSLVHRKFLQLPNPARWKKDMKQMKQLGINWIRTGIWTGFRQGNVCGPTDFVRRDPAIDRCLFPNGEAA